MTQQLRYNLLAVVLFLFSSAVSAQESSVKLGIRLGGGLSVNPGIDGILVPEDYYSNYTFKDKWHVYMNGKPVLDKFGKPITYNHNAQPGSKGFKYNLKGSSAEQKMSFGNWWTFIFYVLFLLSCSNKKTNLQFKHAKYYDSPELIMIDPVYSNGKNFYNKDRIKDSIDDKDLQYINKIIKKKMETMNDMRPFDEYFKQYIAYKEKGRKKVYVNIFEYMPIINGLTPHIYRKIIKINGENNASGYMIIDYSTGKIIECKFDE